MDENAPAPTAVSERISTSDIREANVAALCTLLRENGDMTRADLGRASGLTRPTVMAVVKRLLAQGWVTEPGEIRVPAGGGRPGSLLRFRAGARVLGAVRFRAGALETVLVDLTGTVVARSVAARPAEDAPWTALTEAVVRQLTELRAAHPEAGPLAALALGLPGSVDRVHGRWSRPRRDGWQDLPVGPRLSELLGVPVGVVNIVAAALIGSVTREPVPPASACLVYVGAGVGCATAVRGKLVDGATGSAGELGHCRLPGLTTVCRCGRVGCLETVTSAGHLRRQYSRLAGGDPGATLADIERHTGGGLPEVVDEAADRLALAASWLVNTINPAVVYLGGNPFTDASTLFVDRFAGALREYAYPPDADGLAVRAVNSEATLSGVVHVAGELLPPFLRPALRLAH
ncbi:ROK family protein [Streptomyces sp. NPDC008150]|uniref:ROK family transcriptional regulator n=1 Tax=Streptomyces sp. NPDC008150 TaxID=3364816 RepID=UPI0036E153D3